jgi:ribosome biogenesis GTPase A
MHSTKKAIKERLPDIDVVIELVDARLPGSSSNPLLAEMTRGKPTLKVLTKQDLADPQCTAAWIAYYQTQPGAQALAIDASTQGVAKQLVQACRGLVPGRGGMVKPIRVLVCGIPNVGKSTLINKLYGRVAAKTGDEPGITKTEQKIVLANDFYLYDTPGMLWPRISVEQSGYHLAASGGIGRNAYDEEEVALELLASVRPRFADRLQTRYQLDELGDTSDDALLAAIGRKRGSLVSGGQVNLQKAAEAVINDFRAGAWGRITLETPEQYEQWCIEAQATDEKRLEKRKTEDCKTLKPPTAEDA